MGHCCSCESSSLLACDQTCHSWYTSSSVEDFPIGCYWIQDLFIFLFGAAQIVAFVEVLFDDVDNHVFPLGFVIDRQYLQLGVVPTGQLLSFKNLCYSAASST